MKRKVENGRDNGGSNESGGEFRDWVRGRMGWSGHSLIRETVKTVLRSRVAAHTSLKRGINETRIVARQNAVVRHFRNKMGCPGCGIAPFVP
jgi:hypothetical protein